MIQRALDVRKVEVDDQFMALIDLNDFDGIKKYLQKFTVSSDPQKTKQYSISLKFLSSRLWHLVSSVRTILDSQEIRMSTVQDIKSNMEVLNQAASALSFIDKFPAPLSGVIALILKDEFW